VLALLAALPQVASAGLDLTWNACNTSASGADNVVLNCATPTAAQLFANFQSPQAITQFVAMDIVVDLRTGGGTLPPFWHFESGGCNATGLSLSVSKPTTQCPSATNATPWGPLGTEATSGISAINLGQGGVDRERILIAIARPSTSPFSLSSGQNYFGFELDLATDNAASCGGCTTPAVIGWSTAVLYGLDQRVELYQSGTRLASVAVNGGIPGPTVFTVRPESAPSTEPAGADLFGRNLVPGTSATLTRAGQSDIAGTGTTTSSLGDLLHTTFDITGKPDGFWNVNVANAGNASAIVNAFRTTGAFQVDSMFPRIGELAPTPVTIYGSQLSAPALVRLTMPNHPDVLGLSTTVAADGNSLQTTLPFQLGDVGVWTVEVMNGDGTRKNVPGGFEGVAPLRVASLSPNSAGSNGTALLTVGGSGFRPGLTAVLQRAGQSDIVGNVTSVNPLGTTFVALFDLTGRATGLWDMRVSNPGGLPYTAGNVFLISNTAPPTVTSITPNNGGNAGTLAVMITGTNFDPAAAARLTRSGLLIFGSGTIVSPSGNSLTTSFNLAGAAVGSWNVEVINPGNLVGVLPGGFQVRSGPGLFAVSPSAAVDSEVVRVTITGADIPAGATTKLTRTGQADIVGTSVVVRLDGTAISADFDIRGRLGGLWNVVVVDPDQTASIIPNGFTILKIPTVTAINPAVGSNLQFLTATISGTGFVTGLSLVLERPGIANIPGTGVVVDPAGSTISAQFDLRGKPIGLYDVVVVNPGSIVARLPAAFEVRLGPNVTSVTPVAALDTSVVQLTINGANLLAGADARLTRAGQPDIVGTSVTIGSGGLSLTASFDIRGRAAGPWNVVVTNPGQLSGTLPNAFTITKIPTITAISPTFGFDTQNLFTIITGSRFVVGLTTRLERTGVPPVVGVVTGVAPTGDSLFAFFNLSNASNGLHDVVVVNPGGYEARLPAAFEVRGTLRLTSVTPSAVPDISVASVRVNGFNIAAGATAKLTRSGEVDIPGTSVTIDPSGTFLTADFDVRLKKSGSWNVTVTNPGGMSATLTGGLVIQMIPVVNSISPSSGSSTDVIGATISGSRFASGASVRLRRSGVPDIVGFGTVVYGGGTQIATQLDLRNAADGIRDVVVINPDGGSASLLSAFRVFNGMPVQSITPSNAERGSVITATVTGFGFLPNTIVKLSRIGLPDIVGTSLDVDPGGSWMTAEFDLLNAALGYWDVAIVNPDSSTGSLTNGFHVDPGPLVSKISPSTAGNGGLVNVVVTGESLGGVLVGSSTTLTLRRAGQSDIVPLGPYVSPDGTAMSAVLDLAGKATGFWDVYVTSTTGARSILTHGLEIIVAPPTLASGLDLTWSACNLGTTSGTGDITFDCANPAFQATLFGNYRLPQTMSQLVAMEAVLDIQTSSSTLPPFWHFEQGGCNADGLSMNVGRPAVECPSASNGTAWGSGGSSVISGISGYLPGLGGPSRARLLLQVARPASSPIAVPGGTNYYAFHLGMFMDGAGGCAGCTNPADILWSSATFYSLTSSEPPITVESSGLRGNQVGVNGGLPGLSISSVSPSFTPAVGYVPVSIFGRNFLPGATARLFRLLTPSFSVSLTNVVVASDGRSLTALADLRGAPPAPLDVEVQNPGGAVVQRAAAIDVGTSFPGGPRVTVVTPNGGETFLVGSTAVLSWQAFDDQAVTSVDLSISQHGIGGPYETLGLGLVNSGGIAWVVSSPINDTGFQCFFKVVAHDNDGNISEDVSDSPWRIASSLTATLVARFDATPLDRGIEVSWQIGQASRLSRIGLERSDEALGPWTAIDAARAVTEEMVVVQDLTTAPGRRYFYRLHGAYAGGDEFIYGPIAATASGGVDPSGELALSSVAPNPTSGPTTVLFTLASESKVRVSVLDVMGRELAVLTNGTMPAGRHEVRWDGRARQGAAPTGMYFMRMEAAGRTFTKRFVMAR
jgi:hypothetical protein